jgi:hypothetical protein
MRSILLRTVLLLLANASIATEAFAADDVIRACAHKQTGILRFAPLGCLPSEVPLAWNVQGPTGPPGPAGVGSVVFRSSTGAVTTPAGGTAVEIPGLAGTIPVSEGSRLWVQGDFHEHYFCDGYLDRSYLTESWALDLEVDGVIVASREMHGEQGNLYDHESKPFTWVSDPFADGGDHSVRFLLRPPATDGVVTPPHQAKICLGTDGTREARAASFCSSFPARPRRRMVHLIGLTRGRRTAIR